MLDLLHTGWRALSGNVPGGFTPYLVLLLVALLVITSIYRNSGIMSTRRWQRLLLSTLLLFAFGYTAFWIFTVPRQQTTMISCLPTMALDAGLSPDAEQRLLPLNLQLMFPPAGNAVHWQDCRHLICYGDPDSLRDIERVSHLLGADYLIQPELSHDRLELAVYRVRWHYPELLKRVEVCASDPLEAARLLQQALQGEVDLPGPVDRENWLADDLSFVCVGDSQQVIKQLLQLEDRTLLLDEQLTRLLLVTDREQYHNEIVQLLQRLAETDSSSMTLQLLYARWYAGREEWDLVEQALGNALALDPLSAEARYLVSFLLPDRRQRLGMGERGGLLEQLAESAPAWQPGRLYWIGWLEEQGQLQQALGESRELAFLLPDSYYACFRLAMMAFRTQNYLLADNTYLNLTQVYPDRADPHYNLGINKFMIRDYRAGVDAFSRVLELDGEPNAHLYLAKCYAWLGNREKAIYHLRERLKYRSDGDDVQIDEALKELSLYFPERTAAARQVVPHEE